MFSKVIYFCYWLKWFNLGGEKSKVKKPGSLKKHNQKVYANWSSAEYQMHHRNAASNLGMLGEARKLWNKQTPEYRKKKEDEWESRYGKDWRKHVVI